MPLPRAVWLLSWVSFFADVSSEMVYPLLPLFLVGVLGSTKTQLGAVEGAAVLVVAVMTGVAGWRSDLVNKRVPWIRVGYGLPVLGKAVIAVATAWPMVLGGRLLDRFGKGLRGAPRDALIVDAVGNERRGSALMCQAIPGSRLVSTGGACCSATVWPRSCSWRCRPRCSRSHPSAKPPRSGPSMGLMRR